MKRILVALAVACSAPAQPVRPAPPTPVVAPAPVVVDVAPPAADVGAVPPEPSLRLPRNLIERGVEARLVVDPASSGFDGEIVLDVEVGERSSRFWLHAFHLDIRTATLTGIDATPHALASAPHGQDLLELDTGAPVEPGRYKLSIAYAGQYDLVNTAGAFKQTVAGAPYIYTQLEAIYARRVFPCVDEPDAKVPWQLTLDIPAPLVAVSNTPVEQDTALDADHRRVRFQRTPPLPSYLVAFGVGPFEVVDAGATKSGVPVRAITLHGRAADAAWAVKTTPRLLDELEAWFALRYPYPKLDVVSVPLTVGFSAMENAGLVTFTESVMLLDPKVASLERRNRWVVTASHELAHQWFGDDVTMAWWDDIWLNEGFADWLERKIAARHQPAWHDELGDLGERNRALEADALATARAVRQPIATPDDILNVFDGITYAKGASVLGMFESYVGGDAFQRAIRAYVRARAGGNATVDDFVAAVSSVAGTDLGPAFRTFLDRPGAPELTTSLDCGNGSASLELAQRGYAPVGAPVVDETPAPWTIPVCASYDRDGTRAQACTLLAGATGAMGLPGSRCPRWVLPNRDGRGYYHLALTARQSVSLRDEAWPQLTPTERRAAFADVADLALQGRLPVPVALSWVPRLLAAGDRYSIGDAIALVQKLAPLVPDELRGKYELWLRLTFGPEATALGVLPKPGDDLDAETVRRDVVGLALGARDPDLVAQSLRASEHWRDLPQAVRGMVVAAAADVSAEAFTRLLHDARIEQDRARRAEALGALASVRDVERQREALALVLDPQLDIRETMWMLLEGRDEPNRATAREVFRSHQATILGRLPTDDTTGQSLVLATLFTSACDASRRDEVVRYVTETFGKVPGGKRRLDQDVEAMNQCIARRALLEPDVRGWLTGVRAPPFKPKPPVH
jgi:alanyl aminopeptidase